ncbi:MAG TPA: ABC transporter substrate-binding protein, partial [Anaerolineales bacterium]|nr:ABC transporter substrate-binding protein [Anaerolineales bacterium]
NYAVRSGYWPRLYDLSAPDGEFEPRAAADMPSPIAPEGKLFTATVPLRTDLQWTDGTPFSADDVAFTVNTALAFQLGFDWRTYYDPNWLDHAEAVDAHTVKFFFKQAPNVSTWQYGPLLGPVVQQKYWEPRITEASALLPAADSASRIAGLTQEAADLQKRVDALIAEGVHATGEQAHDLQLELKRRQGDLDQATNELARARAASDSAMAAGRQSLYAVDDAGEPMLGDWMPVGSDGESWTNSANPSHPFGAPHFDRAVYVQYPDERSAIAALESDQVDEILEPNGLSSSSLADVHEGIAINPSPLLYFVVVNPSSQKLADPVLRRAMFCSVPPSALIGSSVGALPLDSFVPAGNTAWLNPQGRISCGSGYDPVAAFDPGRAVGMLKSAGYAWATQPNGKQGGIGLKAPAGEPVPPILLMVPSEAGSSQSLHAAQLFVRSANYLGIPVSVQAVDASAIRYAVFNDHQYDMALVGWQVSEYPEYLCQWFGAGNPFGYADDQAAQACLALRSSSVLESSREQLFQIQKRLAQELPFLPLYAGLTYDAYRHVRYPVEHVLGGWSQQYGAPSMALPEEP